VSETKRTDASSDHRSDNPLATDSVVRQPPDIELEPTRTAANDPDQNVVAEILRDDEESRNCGDAMVGLRNGIFMSLPLWLILFVTVRYLF